MKGVGVEQDIALGVSLLRLVISHDDATKPLAQAALDFCHAAGIGVVGRCRMTL